MASSSSAFACGELADVAGDDGEVAQRLGDHLALAPARGRRRGPARASRAPPGACPPTSVPCPTTGALRSRGRRDRLRPSELDRLLGAPPPGRRTRCGGTSSGSGSSAAGCGGPGRRRPPTSASRTSRSACWAARSPSRSSTVSRASSRSKRSRVRRLRDQVEPRAEQAPGVGQPVHRSRLLPGDQVPASGHLVIAALA